MAPEDPSGVLLDYARDKVVLLDESGTFTYANAAVEPILGFEPDDLVGENAFDFVHPDDVDRVRAAFEDTIREDEFVESSITYRHRTSDGSWVHLESQFSNLTDAALDGYVVSSRDVTDRVEAERERRETATRLRELSTSAGDVLWMFDGDWSELLFVNPAYESIYGQPVEALEADPASFLGVIHPDDRRAVEDAMDALSAGTPADIEYRIAVDAAEDRWVWAQATPIIEDGDVVRITGFTRDVTDRRRRERQLLVMDKLLRHNLRNDLNLVAGTADLIEESVPEVADQTAVIRETSEDLLASAEKEREIIALITADTVAERLDLASVVAAAADEVRERFPDASIEVASEPADVRALPQVAEAVAELLENAVRHSDEPAPRVSVTVRPVGEHIELVVEDDAPPIPPIEAAVLTGDHEMDDVYHSSGLGFWLIYWTVELSNGDVTVASGAEGNRVTVTLPRPVA